MITVMTDFPIAYESHDHTEPKGTMNDNTHKPEFVARLNEISNGVKIILADLGCSGGGLVKDMLDDGHQAVGIEGSDYSLKQKRAEWATIPDNLFTADITKPFFVVDENKITGLCDVITAWDVLEHIPEIDISGLITNIRNNLKVGGLFVCSIATFVDEPHHVTLRPKEWWLKEFAKFKLVPNDGELFTEHQMVRQSSFYLTLVRV
jgi:predicted TPR repeat methyltransferase